MVQGTQIAFMLKGTHNNSYYYYYLLYLVS
uniref:Uncharacterized protein n=1 Tax=Anguilla anguilla TaxID=7936 RepID=A0A0E9T1K0_ANGAN